MPQALFSDCFYRTEVRSRCALVPRGSTTSRAARPAAVGEREGLVGRAMSCKAQGLGQQMRNSNCGRANGTVRVGIRLGVLKGRGNGHSANVRHWASVRGITGWHGFAPRSSSATLASMCNATLQAGLVAPNSAKSAHFALCHLIVLPNPSVKRTGNGLSRQPSSAGPAAHCALAVWRAKPPPAAYFKR
jgi:hypothetical protein